MAKINIEYDTVDKSISATQDGKKLNFKSLMLASSYDADNKFNLELYDYEKDEENDMYHSYRTYCKKLEESDGVNKIKSFLDKNPK